MDRSDYGATRGDAATGGHRIYPVLVIFPVTLLVSTLATDLAFWASADHFWARVSEWLLAAGVIMGALAADLGMIEFSTISRVRLLVAARACLESVYRQSSLSSSWSRAGWVAKSSSGIASASSTSRLKVVD